MLGGLLARHDLIVVDNRGTGSSGAIDCPRLQAYKGNYVRELAAAGASSASGPTPTAAAPRPTTSPPCSIA
jgi:hypothetical protein